MGKKKLEKMILPAAAAALAAAAFKRAWDDQKRRENRRLESVEEAVMENRDYGSRRAYIIGGGLASLAAAVYLVRDCRFPGKRITVYEERPGLGGSNEALGTPDQGYLCLGERVLIQDLCKNFWELFESIPSLERPERSVADEIAEFSHAHSLGTAAVVMDQEGRVSGVQSLGLDMRDRLALAKLLFTDEKKLDNLSIQDWFVHTPHLYATNFWYLCQAVLGFRPWSSLFEFRRKIKVLVPVLARFKNMDGFMRTPLNQYDSLIRPMEAYLRAQGVEFVMNCRVEDIEFGPGPGIRVNALRIIHLAEPQGAEFISVKPHDLCIMTSASVDSFFSLGNLHRRAAQYEGDKVPGFLWAQAAQNRPQFGRPEVFFDKPFETSWMSFTVTCRGDRIIKEIEKRRGVAAEWLILKDSSWLMSTVVPVQPHFASQSGDETVFWVWAQYPQMPGNYVAKPMKDCTGEEMLREFLGHLLVSEEEIPELLKTAVNAVPSLMPFGAAPLQPRSLEDRPRVVPAGAMNFAMVGQFVEIARDPVLTEEYAVRTARTAVYTLMDVNRPVYAAAPLKKIRPGTLLKALSAALK